MRKNRKRAGAMTERFSEEPYLYLSIYAAQNRYGVIGIFIGQKPLDVFENSILLSILGECAMALDREQSAREKEEAAVMAKNEQLRVNLLRTISHDLRTPANGLLGLGELLIEGCPDSEENRMLADMFRESSQRMRNLKTRDRPEPAQQKPNPKPDAPAATSHALKLHHPR